MPTLPDHRDPTAAATHPGEPGRPDDHLLWDLAAEVTDPEMPMLTLADLGVLRGVERDRDDHVVVTITPTYAGCPALDAMADDLRARLAEHGEVEVRVSLTPPWTTDLISDDGRRKLAEAGVAPPAHVGPRSTGPVALSLAPPEKRVDCPRCGSTDTEVLSRFGPTACTALRRCRACREPFEHMKDI